MTRPAGPVRFRIPVFPSSGLEIVTPSSALIAHLEAAFAKLAASPAFSKLAWEENPADPEGVAQYVPLTADSKKYSDGTKYRAQILGMDANAQTSFRIEKREVRKGTPTRTFLSRDSFQIENVGVKAK